MRLEVSGDRKMWLAVGGRNHKHDILPTSPFNTMARGYAARVGEQHSLISMAGSQVGQPVVASLLQYSRKIDVSISCSTR